MSAERPGPGVSRQALTLARMADRLFRLPGRYLVLVEVPPNRRAAWHIEVTRLEPLQRRGGVPPAPTPA